MSDAEPLVLLALDGPIATLTLNRPQRRNALSPELLQALLHNLALVKANPLARVLILTGAGDAFCAGGDLGQAPADGLLDLHQSRALFIDVVEALAHLGKPTIAQVGGLALGGGFGLMLATDMVVAADTAHMGTPEIKVGLFPMMIMALIFRNLGRKKATELMFTGDRLSPHEALALGLINRVVPAAELRDHTLALAHKVAAFSPAVLKLGRDAIYQTMDMPLDDALHYLRAQLTLNTLLDDAAEGVTAFLSKRPPEWKGR